LVASPALARKAEERNSSAARRARALEHFPAKWPRSAAENASDNNEHFPAKWIRFAVENA
jgi:hypothetical protein